MTIGGSPLSGLGDLRPHVEEWLGRMKAEHWAARLNAKDGSLWADDPARASDIAAWMGWLNVARDLAQELAHFDDLRGDLREGGFTRAVLAGMGGSSLCPDVLRQTFGSREGALALTVLDSTDPSTVAAAGARVDPERTLFIIASKSGGTTETLSHFRFFLSRMRQAEGDHAGHHFLAITDAGSMLEQWAAEEKFGWVFLNPADIGGRYSALSYFGMVPAAAMGLDVGRLLAGAQSMADACAQPDPEVNPGLLLGAVLGAAATAGRDKCTIICAPAIATFGMWLEQLLAESTGKEGRGIVPVEHERLGAPEVYGDDRLFVYVRTALGSAELDLSVEALRVAGQPVYTIEVEGPDDLGAEFFRWEFATAAAGAILRINPFDQPNVQESKDNTRAALARFLEKGDFGVDVGDAGLSELLAQLGAGDYFAILAYTQADAEVAAPLERLRLGIRDRFKVATTLGYGPRYLHSTGQLHKGGPNSGVFLLLTDERGEDLPIPGEDYGFKTLIQAQSMGDLKSLRDHGRRVVLVNMGTDRAGMLARLVDIVEAVPA